ncbi:hypothetical protein FOE78_17865 [Microlunatus elymi]|uniref:Uncharacterized protein n=1 Tax=Microlunatus elymi TaxID=2596828 RepID=A0A516Q2U8_9ACTN|nr:hypothetical protein [Microlunatus elymi]QDP97531.1 hypothetical protein FOE78_17865 [Microlunatus elymi]
MVAEVDAAFAAVRAQHPDWQQKSAACAEYYAPDFDVLGRSAPRTTFLTGVGLQLHPTLDELAGKEYSAALSAERLDLLGELDLVHWCTDSGQLTKLKNERLVTRLDSTAAGRVIWSTGDNQDHLLWAMNFGTVLSSAYAIEHGVPLVASALEGRDPDGQQG